MIYNNMKKYQKIIQEEIDMKKAYVTPIAEMLVFDYADNVVASAGNPMGHHADMGIGVGHGGGCDHNPGHGNPHKPHPVFPGGKP